MIDTIVRYGTVELVVLAAVLVLVVVGIVAETWLSERFRARHAKHRRVRS